MLPLKACFPPSSAAWQERFHVALRHGHPEESAPHINARYGIVSFSLRQQPFRIGNLDEVRQSGLVPGLGLGFRLAGGIKLDGSVPCHLQGGSERRLGGRDLTAQIL